MDRRRWPRREVAWSVVLFVTDTDTIVTKVLDASLYGVRLAVSPEVAARRLRYGETYRFEVHLPGSQARFVRLGTLRYVGEDGVGLCTLEALPEPLIQPRLGRPAVRARQASAASSEQPRLSRVEPAAASSLARRILSRLTARA